MPNDFPTIQYEAIFDRVSRSANSRIFLDQFAPAWNAIAYRYKALAEDERDFTALVGNTVPEPQTRYQQERALFGFFSNGFSIFESTFYGFFALGAILSPSHFPIASPRDHQKITPQVTAAAFKTAFAGNAINDAISTLIASAQYIEWREIRNILTHRAAPGRTFFVGLGGSKDEPLPDQWKIKGIALDRNMAASRRKQLSGQLSRIFDACQRFVEGNI